MKGDLVRFARKPKGLFHNLLRALIYTITVVFKIVILYTLKCINCKVQHPVYVSTYNTKYFTDEDKK